jgi:hypothetical protein
MNSFDNLFKTVVSEENTPFVSSAIPHEHLKNFLSNLVKTNPDRVVEMLFDVFTEPNTDALVDELYKQIKTEISKPSQPA